MVPRRLEVTAPAGTTPRGVADDRGGAAASPPREPDHEVVEIVTTGTPTSPGSSVVGDHALAPSTPPAPVTPDVADSGMPPDTPASLEIPLTPWTPAACIHTMLDGRSTPEHRSTAKPPGIGQRANGNGKPSDESSGKPSAWMSRATASSSAEQPTQKGLTIILSKVSLSVPVRKGKPKQLLLDINGVIEAGRCHAMMGASGAGKTTLLDFISKRRQRRATVAGELLYDGVRATKKQIQRETAYVQQHDALPGNCTVYETLLFTAVLMLTKLNKTERKSRVEETLKEMGLERCRSVIIGDRYIKGISGGEAKRVSIGCSLMLRPRCMFLDEPTTGLDSATARGVVGTIKRVQGTLGCTLLMTIHQPSPTIYDLFDIVVLLHKGQLTYWGPGHSHPISFFAEQGFPYKPGYNIAEFLLETLVEGSVFKLEDDSEDSEAAAGNSSSGREDDSDNQFADYYHCSALGAANRRRVNAAIDAREETTQMGENVQELVACSGSLGCGVAKRPAAAAAAVVMEGGRGTGVKEHHRWMVCEILILLAYRELRQYKNPLYYTTQIGLPLVLSLLLSSFFAFQTYDVVGITNVSGVLFISILIPSFMAQVAAEMTKEDRHVYTREFQDNYYRPLSFIVAKTLSYVPSAMLAGVTFSTVLYHIVGLSPQLDRLGFFMLAMFGQFITGNMLGIVVACLFTGLIIPGIILPLLLVLNMLVSGFYVRYQTIPEMWVWLYHISWFQWGFSALMVNQFAGEEYGALCEDEINIPFLGPFLERMHITQDTFESFIQTSGCEPIAGDEVLKQFSMEDRDKWHCLGYSSAMFGVFFVIAYFAVKYVRHPK